MDISPARKSHPFWKSAVGSELLLEMIIPPESQLLSLHLQVCTLGMPTKYQAAAGSASSFRARSSQLSQSSGSPRARIYKISASYSSGLVDTIFAPEKEARGIVSNEWLCFYSDRTRVIFQKVVEAEEAVPPLNSPKSPKNGNDSLESSPRYSASPRNSTSPRSISSMSPGRTSGSSGAAEHSPRDWLKKRLSLPLRITRNTLVDDPVAPAPATEQSDSEISSGETSPFTSPRSSLAGRLWFLRRSPRELKK